MAISERIQQELDLRFVYHAPTTVTVIAYERLRAKAKEYAELIAELVPESREQSLAFTALEESAMWANAGVARRTPPLADGD